MTLLHFRISLFKVLLPPQFVVILVRHRILGVTARLFTAGDQGHNFVINADLITFASSTTRGPDVFYPRSDNYLLQVCNKLTTPALLFLPNIHARFILVYDHNYAMLSFTMCNTEYFGFKVIKPKT